MKSPQIRGKGARRYGLVVRDCAGLCHDVRLHRDLLRPALSGGRSRRGAFGETLHQSLKVCGWIVEGDGDSVGPNDAFRSRNGLAADHGSSQSTGLGFPGNV